jgi:putative acetyltransferase
LPLYLEIVAAAIRELAASHYSPEAIEGWAPKITDQFLADLATNADGELRLIAELDGAPAGIGALVVGKSELRACYVLRSAARRGCGSALVREIERLASEHGLSRLELAGSLNAEPFYASLGYGVRERSDVALPNGHRLPCVWMEKLLC